MSDRAPRASRLAVARWLDTRVVVGVLLVLASVVAGSRILASSDRYAAVYAARSPLTPGERVGSADLEVARVRFAGAASAYIRATAAAPLGYTVTRYVGAGELVPVAALSAASTPADATRLVTVPVPSQHLPQDIARGDLVDVYLTAKGSGGTPRAPRRVLRSALVEGVQGASEIASDGSSVGLVLAVPTASVPVVIGAVEGGALDVVRVPGPIDASDGSGKAVGR